MPHRPESTYRFSTPTEHTFVIEGLSQSDRYSLIGPSGLSIVAARDDRPIKYRVEGVTNVDVSSSVPEGTVVVGMENKSVAAHIEEWVTEHFDNPETGVYAMRRVTEAALRNAAVRRHP